MDRVTELEIKVAFQEKQLEDLDGQLRELRAEIEHLKHEIARRGDLGPRPGLGENPLDL